jgi:hypothetical protein
MAKAEIELEILEDGTISWKTGRIPDIHHSAAESLLKDLEVALGGDVTRKQTAAKPIHAHHHDHIHTHEGDG